MKKFMFIAALMLNVSAAFAGDSDALKSIMKAKTYADAESLLKNSMALLASPQEKAKAYNRLVDLSLEQFNAISTVMVANDAAVKLNQGKVEPVDTVLLYNSAYNALANALECEKYDNMPDEKGRVKPKYSESNAARIANPRIHLVNAGQYAAGKNDNEGVLKYWGMFLDTESSTLLAKIDKSGEANYLGQVAYFTALYANQAKDYARAEKYCDIALKDPTQAQAAQNLKFAIAQHNLKTKEDSIRFIAQLKEEYTKDPSNEAVFGTLSTLYSNMNMNEELNSLIADKIARDPNNATAWAFKGQLEMNKNDWDNAINSFKKSAEIDGTNPTVLTYLGFCINSKAAAIENNRAAQKDMYKESMEYLERAKEIDPNRERANWAYPLFQCYYLVYSANDPRTKEMESLLNNK